LTGGAFEVGAAPRRKGGVLAAWIRGLSGEGQSRNFEDGGHGVSRNQNNKIATSTPKPHE
jgi:hypothetical protein